MSDLKPEVPSISPKAITPEWVAAELQSKIEDVTSVVVLICLKDGRLASLSSDMGAGRFALHGAQMQFRLMNRVAGESK